MWLLASDLHLTDLARDEYRNGIFDFLAERARVNHVDHIILLGDITDRKDHHSGKLINFIASSISKMSEVAHVHILQGNHDYADADGATFKLFRKLSDLGAQISYYDKPQVRVLRGKEAKHNCLFFPFQRKKEDFLEHAQVFAGTDFTAVFFHQTFYGATTSTGLSLPGVPTSAVSGWLSRGVKMFSGDIHVPQTIGGVEYVGSPYQINFGDKFLGRVVLFDPMTRQQYDQNYPCLKKHTIDINSPMAMKEFHMSRGDQVKVRLHLTRSEQVDWLKETREIEQIADEMGVTLFGREVVIIDENISSEGAERSEFSATDYSDVFNSFCADNAVAKDLADEGKRFLTTDYYSEHQTETNPT